MAGKPGRPGGNRGNGGNENSGGYPQTECKNGHSLMLEQNVILIPRKRKRDGKRILERACRVCRNKYQREWRAKQKAA